MRKMLIQAKNIKLDRYIPYNSKIAITDICYEDVNYNINTGAIRVTCILPPAAYYNFFEKYPHRENTIIVDENVPYWHNMNIWLTPGAYSSLKDFVSECKLQSSKKASYGDRTLLTRLFTRFAEHEGRIKFTPDITPESNLQYIVKFGSEISACLGLPDADIFINSTGHYISYSLFFKEARPINFNIDSILPITCEQVENLSGDKTLEYLHIKGSQHKMGYTQIKDLTYRNLIGCNLMGLNFNWPESVKIIFMNISIAPQ